MERLAKEKIAAQNRILCLKRELAHWEIDFTKLLPEQTDITVKTERTGKNACHISFSLQELSFSFAFRSIID